MAYYRPSQEELEKCMRNPKCVRNVSILAHVDHGKTTIADSLLATNRLVNRRMAGNLRYLDDRRDEQERKITMKSSAVSLLNVVRDERTNNNRLLLLNLIDTPGHIDFSTEVTAAVRVCDGALILVDVVEGVCVQTREAIKQAFDQKVRMILVVNKLDRYFTHLPKGVDEIFQSVSQVIENCNAVIAELYQYAESDRDIEDTGLLFQPDKGNVIFASALDGWGFTLRQLAETFCDRLPGESIDSLTAKLWNFDSYVDAKTRTIKTGAVERKKSNLFAQLCLKTLEHVYSTIVVRMERDKVNTILEKLKVTHVTRDMSHTDTKIQIKAIMEAWKPLAETILAQCLAIIPSPVDVDPDKIDYLLGRKLVEDDRVNDCIDELAARIATCSNDDAAPVVLYVSKMFCVNKANLSQNKPKAFVPRPRGASDPVATNEAEVDSSKTTNGADDDDETVTVALARIFSGTLRKAQRLYLIPPGYVPTDSSTLKVVEIQDIYMLLGRELLLAEAIPAGNVCAVSGLDAVVFRTATLSSTLKCVPFVETQPLEPVVRNVIEPVTLSDLPILRRGLKKLMQNDSCVQVVTQETGELVLLTSGDVHLEKCLEDLRSKFAKIDVNVSSPMVSLKETVLLANNSKKYDYREDDVNTVRNEAGPLIISVIVVPIPENIVAVIKSNFKLLRTIEEHSSTTRILETSNDANPAVRKLKEQLKKTFGAETNFWATLYEKIWSVGTSSDNINLLIDDTSAPDAQYRHHIKTAFENCCKAGPICEEPLTDCCFIVRQCDAQPSALNVQQQLKTVFRDALNKRPLRLMEPMFTTDVQVNTSILGKVYTVIGKRHGKVLDAVGMDEDEKTFLVKAQIPVAESEGFATEIRKTTSGQAMPNLKFSRYEIVDGDPFDEPEEDEEQEEEDEGRAMKLRKTVRKRKGLHVDEHLVVFGEKQRTLNKKK